MSCDIDNCDPKWSFAVKLFTIRVEIVHAGDTN